MRRKLLCCCFVPALMLLGADPHWMSKRIAEWSDEDVKQILTKSPWVKENTPGKIGVMTSGQRRDSGDMRAGGGGQGGVGTDAANGTGILGGKSVAEKNRANIVEAPLSHNRLQIRWESAMPIRAAEFRANEPDVPDLEGEEYAIAVYNVSLKTAILELKGLTETLKRTATLKVEGRLNLKPSRVAVIEPGGGTINVVYLFPRSARLSLEDPRIDFAAQIGLVFVAQSFYPQEMRFQGKLEL